MVQPSGKSVLRLPHPKGIQYPGRLTNKSAADCSEALLQLVDQDENLPWLEGSLVQVANLQSNTSSCSQPQSLLGNLEALAFSRS